mmetsp:Transcript_18647/g.22905  ORF Transcript_18647/g.22905 Transcript_18647/m.22905 type:complete len:98 (-) Transcript_18647:61-354(-)
MEGALLGLVCAALFLALIIVMRIKAPVDKRSKDDEDQDDQATQQDEDQAPRRSLENRGHLSRQSQKSQSKLMRESRKKRQPVFQNDGIDDGDVQLDQ